MITVGYCSPGSVSTRFSDSLIDLMLADARVSSRISRVSGPRIASARNDIVDSFLKMQQVPEWLLMLDSDMSFDTDIVERMIQASHEKIRPVVGGLCFGGGRVGVPFPTLYKLVDKGKGKGQTTEVINDYPKDALCKVDATGAACLFIHREVLLQMKDKFGTLHNGVHNPQPWFAETIYQGYEWGEDWTFCMRLKQMNIPLYVHTGIKLGHVKTHLYDEEFYNKMRSSHGTR